MSDREVFDDTLAAAAGAMSLRLEGHHYARMWQHFELMVEANRHFNLTRITAPADAALRHYADSLTLLATSWVDRDRPLTLLDVGTGADFPAVPLAILCDRWRVMAIDGTGKKARFVADAAAALGLANLDARQVRAADLAKPGGATSCPPDVAPAPRHRLDARASAPPAGSSFDLVVMRAVTRLAPGIDEVHALVNTGGAVVFYKSGTIGEAELAAGEAQARRRGLPAVTIHTLQLPSPTGPLDRRLIRYAREN